MTRYRVVEGTQVNVDGTVHEPGATVDLDEANADRMVRKGWLEPVDDPPSKAKQRNTRGRASRR